MDVVQSRDKVARLRKIARNIPFFWKMYWIYWRVRSFIESRRSYALEVELIDFGDDSEPVLERPASQLCTARQIFSPRYTHWCRELDSPPRFMRKQWEYIYIIEALFSRGVLKEGSKGLGFGCGAEPLPGVFAKYGCDVLATDQELTVAQEQGWVSTSQHSNNLDELYLACNKVIDKKLFAEKVSFANADMNQIPDDFCNFDFVWSACALEHLGSLEHGARFVRNTINCLKPGGIAVHTTEFNLSSDDETLESPGCSVYRKRDILELIRQLRSDGCLVAPLNLNHGNMPVDRYIDVPPYGFSPHLKLKLDSYVVTSIGLIIQRGNN